MRDRYRQAEKYMELKYNNKYDTFSWLSAEGKEFLIHLDNIVENRDMISLYTLDRNSDFATTLHQILIKVYNEKKEQINQPQLNLFLCMHLENSGQSGHILTFFQEWFPEHTDKIVNALKEIGAYKSSEIIQQAINLLPKDGSCFFDSAKESSEILMDKLDHEFSNYPDGSMNDLYRSYAEKHKESITKIICK